LGKLTISSKRRQTAASKLVGVVGRADEEHLVLDERDLVDALEQRVDGALDGGVLVRGARLGDEVELVHEEDTGASRFATSKVFSTFLAVSPRYWEVIIDSFTSTKGSWRSWASARATLVFRSPAGRRTGACRSRAGRCGRGSRGARWP